MNQADLCSFHRAHFGQASTIVFTTDFLSPDKAKQEPEIQDYERSDEAYYEDDEDEDGLGYYSDGVKRTLTDEQIAMFRHSETQALQRARERATTQRNSSSPPLMHAPAEDPEDDRSEDGELSNDVSNTGVVATRKKKKNKKKKKRGSGNGKRHYSPDPERRKRTWDVVETGLDGLDYGESGQSQAQTSPARQRRRITYDDG